MINTRMNNKTRKYQTVFQTVKCIACVLRCNVVLSVSPAVYLLYNDLYTVSAVAI